MKGITPIHIIALLDRNIDNHHNALRKLRSLTTNRISRIPDGTLPYSGYVHTSSRPKIHNDNINKIYNIIDMHYNTNMTTKDICSYIGRDCRDIYSILKFVLEEDSI